MTEEDAVRRQREYYERTAGQYDDWHGDRDDEHALSLALVTGVVDLLGARSVLDVGSGTGRAIQHLKRRRPGLRVHGIEPVAALREVGYAAGLSQEELTDGDATKLNFADGSFDLVCEFAVLHHLPRPEIAVREMLRVASRAIFISDSNRWGQGSASTRAIKNLLRLTHMWPVANYIKTRGRGYDESESDGISFSYSVFDNYDLIASHCKRVHVLNTQGDGRRALKASPHVALLGIK